MKNEDTKLQLGSNIKSRRIKAGLSQQRFALMIGMSRYRLRKIEEGDANPTLDTLMRIASGLDLEVKDLFR